ncbi:MAG: carbohydrate porin [Phycisphaerae bacterium]|nr:carbohydrate porin [Phycisphaerae bacterium]MDD5380190.1 carbohydrate porin [Phycisphaerae bacterium]
MKKMCIVFSVTTLLAFAQLSSADIEPNCPDSIWERETLSSGFFGLNDKLADKGLEMAIGVTNIYQQNLRGGISTHRRAGRFSGSYDLELSADSEKLLGIKGGRVFVHTEGVWSKSAGIDGPSVGSAFGVNGDARDRRTIDVTELWYEQSLLDETLRVRLGKMDLTCGFEHHNCPVSFDCSNFANDETSQFLNGALINNPTIPFPDYGLGASIHYVPAGSWYVSAAVADAQADLRETGFRTTFCGPAYFFYIFETGITPQFESAKGPLQGAYRLGLWYDPQPKANSDSANAGRDDVGFYATCDQMLIRENDDPQDSQGLGTFFRYGHADSKRNDIVDFWSFGFQYQGIFDGRDDDTLGLGFAQGFFSNYASTTYTDDYESALELYYNARITPWLNISPSIQYIANPGGNKAADNAVVLGVRAQMIF